MTQSPRDAEGGDFMSNESQTQNLTGTQMANLIGVDPKDFRRFVRKAMRAAGRSDALPGSGSRYSFSSDEAEAWADAYFADVRSGRRSAVTIADLTPTDDE